MSKSNRTILILVISIIAALIFVGVFVRATWYVPIDDNQSNNSGQNIFVPSGQQGTQDILGGTSVTADMRPARLIIPTLKINTDVQHVGIAKDGTMGVPNNYTDVGWYMYGALPGNVGAAVMAGHVDNGVAAPGVFKKLDTLSIGDEVIVEQGDGTQLLFRIIGSQIYDKDADAKEVFIEKEKKLLRLITCTGEIIRSERTHADRLVVTAELVQ